MSDLATITKVSSGRDEFFTVPSVADIPSNFIINLGQVALVKENRGLYKGDGVTAWSALPSDTSTYVQVIEYPPCPQQYRQAGDPDYTLAFQRMFAAGLKSAYVPPSSIPYNIATGLTMPVTMKSLTLDQGATVCATAPITGAMLTIGDLATQYRYGYLGGGTWDCNNLAQDGIKVRWHWGQTIADTNVEQHARHGVILGELGSPSASNEHKVRGLTTWRPTSTANPAGSYGLWLAYSHDGDASDVTVCSAETSFRMDSLGSRFISCHAWSNASGPHATSFYDQGNNDYIGCESDNPSLYGWDLKQWNTRIIGGFSLLGNPALNGIPIAIHCGTPGNDFVGSILNHAIKGSTGANWARDFDGPVPYPGLTIAGCGGELVNTTTIMGKAFLPSLETYGTLRISGDNSGPRISGGLAAPGGLITGSAGDFWLRNDSPGVAHPRIYICTGGTNWTAVI